ncbi:SigE family RNA polymerase sigma factor [Kribbella sandramycini]|uniref:RNA polymerase sigma-70 factor (Sigma-E family) n=1 Tax=Kribbella sandramycini TaxID=60450 RepID=A0A7Y4NY12_9ACTN|nr:SigE family RNA polymerase sigma factor [Kribbella sandramycini]MBB6569713.1 RNA polymerase sigma-70 factor (sigma-E family) [Kribbella sandramycini]NOL40457.1 SigE family RNA polymerase sigma factor [Kribbella sandramycini]
MSSRDAAFEAYFAARSDAMRGTAYLLCGDWHRAEDLVQQTFTKLYLAWNRIQRHESMDNYTRQTLVRTFLSERRRGWFRFESVGASPSDRPAPASGLADERMILQEALLQVPPRQRAVLVLRYWEDASVEQTAALLDCSVGNVKSQASRGLQTLRGLLHEEKVR